MKTMAKRTIDSTLAKVITERDRWLTELDENAIEITDKWLNERLQDILYSAIGIERSGYDYRISTHDNHGRPRLLADIVKKIAAEAAESMAKVTFEDLELTGVEKTKLARGCRTLYTEVYMDTFRLEITRLAQLQAIEQAAKILEASPDLLLNTVKDQIEISKEQPLDWY
jgi:hypothetical protein